METSSTSAIQFGPGGEQWADIPIGAAIYAGDGVPVGTVMEVGTTYLRAGASMIASSDLYVPLRTISWYDPQQNIVHLTALSDAVRAMAGSAPATDTMPLQPTTTMPMAPIVTPVREFTIALREEYLVVAPLPAIVKDVTVRRDPESGKLVTTEVIRPMEMPPDADKSS